MRRIVVALLLLAGVSSAGAQATDSALTKRIKQDTDSISAARNITSWQVARNNRALLRIKSRADSILTNKTDTVKIVRVDTVVIKDSTIVVTPPDTTKPPVTQVYAIAIHSNGVSVNVGSTLQLSSGVTLNGAPSNAPVTWSVTEGSRNYGNISSTGLLSGTAAGLVTVVAKVDTFKTTRDYTVIGTTPPDTTVTPPDTTTPPIVVTPGGGNSQWTHPFGLFSNGAVPAEFPRDTVPVGYPVAVRKIAVTPSTVQAALDTAKTGDELLLPPGSVTTWLNVKASPRTGWVTVRTAVPDDGDIWKMMTLGRADSLNLAIIQSTGSNVPALHFDLNSHHIRFTLVKILQSYPGTLSSIVTIQSQGETATNLPHHIVFDRIVVNAGNNDTRRCIYANGNYIAVISSQLRNCHSNAGDSQGFLSINGYGPFRIENNYIEAGHQWTMSGGGDPSIPNLIPCDWVIRNNIFTRPMAWRGVWQAKTGIETKNQCRALYEYNFMENVWPDAQVGFGILLKSTNQDGTAPWSQTKDVTFRYNRLRNMTNGFNLAANPQGGVPMTRVSVYDNVIEPMPWQIEQGGHGIPVQFLGGLTDMVFVHNTWQPPSGLDAISVDGGANVRTVMRSNYIPHGQYGIKGSNQGDGATTIAAYFLNSLWEDNAVISGGSCTQYPATTTCPSTLPSSPPLGADGKPLGADLTKVHP
jgi:hypothetical protein